MSDVIQFTSRTEWEERLRAKRLQDAVESLYKRLGTNRFRDQEAKNREERNKRVSEEYKLKGVTHEY